MPSQNPHRPSHTKIVATLGPASDGPEMVERLIRAGVDVFRLNMAHGGPEFQQSRLDTIREASAKLNQPVGVLADLAGPKIRLGVLPDGMYQCNTGETVRFIRGDVADEYGHFTCTYDALIDELEIGDRVMLADGTVSLTVEEKSNDAAVCRVVQAGLVRSRQGVNLPGVKLSIPTIQPIDRENAVWASKAGVDFLGLSFVRTAQDIHDLQEIIASAGGHAQVIAKIEKPEALEHLEAIVDAADGVMVARGDLGVETDLAEIAVVQKRIIETCRRRCKPVITATQMLDSMQHESMPTRAEATDVANAVLDGTDACMLSGETAIGDYPVESVEMMHRIALATESIAKPIDFAHTAALEPMVDGKIDPITLATSEACGQLAQKVGASSIFVATHNGLAALILAKQRRQTPTFGVSDNPAALQRMALYWGVIPVPHVAGSSHEAMINALLQRDGGFAKLTPGDRVVVMAGVEISDDEYNALWVHVVK